MEKFDRWQQEQYSGSNCFISEVHSVRFFEGQQIIFHSFICWDNCERLHQIVPLTTMICIGIFWHVASAAYCISKHNFLDCKQNLIKCGPGYVIYRIRLSCRRHIFSDVCARYYITIRRWTISGVAAEPNVLQKDSTKKELCSRIGIFLSGSSHFKNETGVFLLFCLSEIHKVINFHSI